MDDRNGKYSFVMRRLRLIPIAALATLLILPGGAVSAGGVFCVEVDGSISVEMSGCDCSSQHTQSSVSDRYESDTVAQATGDDFCKPCIDIPLVESDRYLPRTNRTSSVKVIALATSTLPEFNQIRRDRSFSHPARPSPRPTRLASTGSMPLRI